ncbi:MAG: hypothetical protein LBP39_01845 [Rickettsiales bacterium]|jgi:glucose-6-phosphate isomerase|nr:hypothetical protein [Rickettsiales bacterium]
MLLYRQTLLNCSVENTDLLKKVLDRKNALGNELHTNSDYRALTMARETNDLEEIIKIGTHIRNNFEQLVVIGIGGSSLATKTFLALKEETNVIVLENIDSHSVKQLFSELNIDSTAFLAISKSGKTIECISQTLLLMHIVKSRLGAAAVARHFFFLTEKKDNPLSQLAKEFSIDTIEHDSHIGGRFSYLSNVALIPACVAGLDVEGIRNAAADLLDKFFDRKEDSIVEICAKQCELYKNNVFGSVTMSYIDRLENLSAWYGQLLAESLGKNGFGVVPIRTAGTVDQHSQLQLYMDGPKNLFFTFFVKTVDKNSIRIEETYIASLGYLKNKTLDELMDIESMSTMEVLNKRNLPIRLFKLDSVDERCLSQIMMQYMLEIILIGHTNNINPFGQPAVEERKILARKMLENL